MTPKLERLTNEVKLSKRACFSLPRVRVCASQRGRGGDGEAAEKAASAFCVRLLVSH